MKEKILLLTSVLIIFSNPIFAQYDCASDILNDSFYSSKSIKNLVITYGNVMDSLAKSSIDFGADTETQWASDTIHSIWEQSKAGQFDFTQKWADIMLMQRYFAYGINYVPSTFCHSKYYQYMQDGGYTVVTMLYECYSSVDSLYADNKTTSKVESLLEMSAQSLTCMDAYFLLSDDLNQRDSNPMLSSLSHVGIIDSLKQYNDSINLLAYKWYLDGTATFQSYCQWIKRTCQSQERFLEIQPTIIRHAKEMDKFGSPIQEAYQSGKALPPVSKDDFHQYMVKTLQMRIELAKILTKNFTLLK